MTTAASEWRAHWRTVGSAMAGFSVVAIATTTMSLFVQPLSEEFGWGRATVTAGLLIFAAVGVLLSPSAGALVDRWGARRTGIPGILVSSLCFAGFALANGSVWQWLALWVVYSLVEVTIKSYVWATAVSNLFTASRGLAVAITLCGGAITQTLAPLIAEAIMSRYGWRSAYVGLGLGWGGIALLLVVLFFDDGRGDGRRARIAHKPLPAAADLPGLTFSEAIRTRPIQIITLITVLQTFVISSTSVHKVPMLTEIGMSRGYGAMMVSLAGFGAIVGKLVTGFFLDRNENGLVGKCALSLPAVSLALLLPARAGDSMLILASMAIIGFAGGASLQVVTYWTSRYAGLKSFGKTYGLITSAMALATGVGPVTAGAVFDYFGTYRPFIVGSIPVGLVCCLLAMRLGRYPDWGESMPEATPLDPEPCLSMPRTT